MLLAALGTASRGGEHGPRIFFPLLLILLLGLLIGKIVRHRRGGSHGYRHGSPQQTLEERFARGEIDRAEFEHRKAVLDGSDDVPPAPARPMPPQAPPTGAQDSTAPDVDSPDLEDEA